MTKPGQLPSKVMLPGHENPQTVPFIIEGAAPSDTLAIRIHKLEPARDYGLSSSYPGFGALNATDRTAEIRVLVSADSGGKLFDLRAELRERLMAWLVRFEDGRYLPRTRIDGVEPLVQRSEREPAPSSERRTTPRHAT